MLTDNYSFFLCKKKASIEREKLFLTGSILAVPESTINYYDLPKKNNNNKAQLCEEKKNRRSKYKSLQDTEKKWMDFVAFLVGRFTYSANFVVLREKVARHQH